MKKYGVLGFIILLFSGATLANENQVRIQAMNAAQEAAFNAEMSAIDSVPHNPAMMTKPPTIAPPPAGTPPIAGCCSVVTTINQGNLGACSAEGPIGTQDRITNDVACGIPKTIGSFTIGSPAEAQIRAIGNNIMSSGQVMATEIEANGLALVNKIGELTTNVTSYIGKFQENLKQDRIKNAQAMADIKLNFHTEMKEREIRARNSEFSLDDTAEEIAFIEAQLDAAMASGEDKPQVLINGLKNKYDANKNFIIPVRIKAADRVTGTTTGQTCAEYDPTTLGLPTDGGACFYAQRATPGKKLEVVFEECSRAKKQTLMSMKQSANSRVVNKSLKNSQVESSNTVITSTKISQTQNAQRMTSCNDKEYGYKMCEEESTPEEYLSKVVGNEIVPNGQVSASNMFIPPVVGTYDGNTAIEDEDLKATLLSMLDKGDGAESNCQLWGERFCGGGNEAVSGNTPPLINTYKTSSQYFAAKDFINNIVNRDLVSNQALADRQKVASSKFQSKFMQRNAALSLSEMVLNSVLENRIGTVIAEEVYNDTLKRDEVVKENISGAGYLDILEDLVEKDYSKLIVDATGQIGGQKTTEALSRTAPKNVKNWQYGAQVLNTKLSFENRMQNEEIELLLATYVSQKSGGAENINFLENLKVK